MKPRRPTTNEFSIINRIFNESVNYHYSQYIKEDAQDGMGSSEPDPTSPYNSGDGGKAERRQTKADKAAEARRAAQQAENRREADDLAVKRAEDAARRAGKGLGFNPVEGAARKAADERTMVDAAARRAQETADRVAAARAQQDRINAARAGKPVAPAQPSGATPATTPIGTGDGVATGTTTGPVNIPTTPGLNDPDSIDASNDPARGGQSGRFGGDGVPATTTKSERKPAPFGLPSQNTPPSENSTPAVSASSEKISFPTLTQPKSVQDIAKEFIGNQPKQNTATPSNFVEITPEEQARVDAENKARSEKSTKGFTEPAGGAPSKGVMDAINNITATGAPRGQMTPTRFDEPNIPIPNSQAQQPAGEAPAQPAGDVATAVVTNPFSGIGTMSWIAKGIGAAAKGIADYTSETMTAGKEVIQQAAKGVGEMLGVKGGQTDMDRQQAANAKPVETDAQGIPVNLKMSRPGLKETYENILRQRVITENPFLFESKHGKTTQSERGAAKARSMGFGVGSESGPRGSVNVDAIRPEMLVRQLTSIINAGEGGEGSSGKGRPALEAGAVHSHDPMGERQEDPRDALKPHIEVLYRAAEESGVELGMSDMYNPRSNDHQALLSKYPTDHPVHAASAAIGHAVSNMPPVGTIRGTSGKSGVHRLLGSTRKSLN